ncbi:hypothetical protein DPEC_G00039390 [Dallia pectoralis]|uniref:Uncharacterized protein n=1 Tax=Dallia pectoralis TaxID=75939 RepID=A0ACC2HEH1_DALPE|nr:hypothetical protein DPEC_G00039390 [Dallia pectoralis]
MHHTSRHPGASVASTAQLDYPLEPLEVPGMVMDMPRDLSLGPARGDLVSALPVNILPEYADLDGVFFSKKARCLHSHRSCYCTSDLLSESTLLRRWIYRESQRFTYTLAK